MMEKPIWWDYVIFYPDEDEEGFDGIHYGGVKGIVDDAPQEVKKEFEKYRSEIDKMMKENIPIPR